MTTRDAQPGQGPVLLIGSMPFETVEDNMRACAQALGRDLAGLPDGEVGERKNWVGMLPVLVFSRHPDLEEVRRPPGGEMHQPDRNAARPPAEDLEGFWTFRIRPGARLRFDDLQYAGFARESYATFRRLRAAGTIDPSVRFQLCLPAPNSAINAFFEDPDEWPTAQGAYMDRLRQEIQAVLQVVPADDLVVQFDLAWEVVDLAMGERNFFRFWPRLSVAEKFERHTAWLAALSQAVPEQALLGYHWCYGTWGGWPMTAMQDLALCVQLSNAAVERATRRVDYVHMPVVRHPEATFFAPLRDLRIGQTRVYLGLVHHTDGVAGFVERMALARQVLPEFGIASVCGYGRVDPSELPEILRVHRACADELQRARV